MASPWPGCGLKSHWAALISTLLGQPGPVLSRAQSVQVSLETPPVSARMSQLAWGFVSNPNRPFVFVLLGAFWGSRVGPGGFGFQRCRQPPWELVMGSHVMPHCAFLGRTRPQGALRRHTTAGHPDSPAACDEVMGGAPETPLQIGRGFLSWPRGGLEERKEVTVVILSPSFLL